MVASIAGPIELKITHVGTTKISTSQGRPEVGSREAGTLGVSSVTGKYKAKSVMPIMASEGPKSLIIFLTFDRR